MIFQEMLTDREGEVWGKPNTACGPAHIRTPPSHEVDTGWACGVRDSFHIVSDTRNHRSESMNFPK